ncbi:ABC transporter substrate-binding protein [Corynebacterium sp.]|uniref:ABC transporter substrate-binding protein n=1 Tax=Corynebacterium sp. TaxID=1720 RepID=UPI002648EB4B|nr:ABC transporter substrate-binding protein [Corynebacterium sp.]MDN5721509.1 ABC transporter substrate-binding protein [Corynebacterium sp.]MDN6281641.1 ABC transporter substrate-binding protein [Corynebacterium sp.]MDN6367330.1 ABC transporter substrate-binding protein [Corynebacterium sp.]MDN6374857.1 ABC transporter substrate-binding protein [Corynebacterium sp.]MDN6395946.1 ABC transporter substrate-binding protein [Corynebacterium sp.]
MLRKNVRRSALAVAATGLVVMLGLTACGGDDNGGASNATGPNSSAGEGQNGDHYPLMIDNCGYQMTFDKAPEKVVIMQGASVGEAETLIELGLEDRIEVSAQQYGASDIPGMAEKVDSLPDDGLNLNDAMDIPAEQVLSRQPDLVLSTYSGGFDEKQGFASRETLENAGINSIVTPPNCSYGKTANITPQEKEAFTNGSVQDSLDYISLIGQIFDVEDKADQLINDLQGKLDAVQTAVQGKEPQKVLIAFPSMAAMNSNGLPAVFSGGIYDSVITEAGGTPSFPGEPGLTATLSPEQMQAADVDLLVVGSWNSGDMDIDAEAQKIFDANPGWEASKNKNYVVASDGVYYGPASVYGVEKIAHAAHPDAF